MPDYKQISQLTEASTISNSDLFIVQQGTTAKKCTGQTFLAMVQAHGGITSIAKTSTSGLVDTYTITYVDNTTSTFTVTNGAQGSTGATGEDAEILLTEYGTSASSSTQPSSWTSSIPAVAGGNFLWTRFTWNNGEYSYVTTRYGIDGQGAGDMLASVYDSTSAVANEGGIVAYVSANGGKIDVIQLNGTPITITNKTVNIEPDAGDIYYDASNSVADKIQAIETSISGVETALSQL